MKELAIFTQLMIRERKDIALSIVGGFIAGIAGVGLFGASGYLISKTVFAPPLYTLIVLTSLVKILGLVRAASRYGERLYSHRATFSLLSRLRTAFFVKLLPLAPGVLSNKRSGELLTRIVGDVESLQFYFLRVAYPPVMVIMVFLATVLFTSIYSVWIALVFVLGMLIATFVIPAIVMSGQRKFHGLVRQQRAAFANNVTEMLYGFRDIKVYGYLKPLKEELELASAELGANQREDAVRLLRGQSLHIFLTFLVSWSVLVLSAYLIVQDSLAGVFLAMLVMTSNTAFEEAAPMATLPAYKQDSEYAAERLTETVLSAEVPNKQSLREFPGNTALSINLREVSYQYEGDWRPVLREVTFALPSGSKTAIVGPSGSGKSTLLELLLKLRNPVSGDIYMNGVLISQLDEEDIWRNSNVVLQHSHFYRGTIRDNLLAEEGRYTDAELTAVLVKVQLINTSLDDSVFERGENLSDGEKQRLAMARAILQTGRLWLLDEPTSSLDYVTERLVLLQLMNRAVDDTLVLVSHRLAGLEIMDQIVVMEQGRVVETGTFTELMELQGYFYRMKQIESQVISSAGD
ncbi:thiol reductant ABC exporter subunit CydC [Paenibacillus typhae]|uniref:ATP-binding cassette, subfamily C, CydC n=1 Tax=Paenibacillus typhae TaxID=1174501 RepID=A0A1G8F9D8_9BACL|nr:thiol reductant ABC exporter subunit CydC [Paenibacillus typhae]SDH78773.1 ATP-binding cassette, subfamily C, CydC [Paenibacillus typhae]